MSTRPPVRALVAAHNLNNPEGAPRYLSEIVLGLYARVAIEPVVYSQLGGDGAKVYTAAGVPVDVRETPESRRFVDGLWTPREYERAQAAAARLLREHRPEVVITSNHHDTFPGGHLNMADHRAVGRAAIDAVRDAANRWLFPEAGEPWTGVKQVLVLASPLSGHAVDVEGSFDRGVASLREHRVYLDGLGYDMDPDAFLRGNAATTGEICGERYAVDFELINL